MNTPLAVTVNCPICKKTVIWNTDNKFRPFCSARCKLIDLGEWANEQRCITAPISTTTTNIDEFA